jgi:hypothetical protein
VTRGLRLAEAALGVGLLLLLPPVAASIPAAPWVWVLCCLLGALVGYVVVTARTAPPSDDPVVRAWYVAGTAVGQGFICWTAAAFLGGALGFDRTAVWLTATGLLVGCAAVAVKWRLGPTIRRVRLAATIAVGLVWAVWPGLLGLADGAAGPAPSSAGAAVFVLLISAVGWESARGMVGTGRQVVLALVIVVALTSGLTALHRGPVGEPNTVFSVLVLVIAASYCVTNLNFAGGLLGRSVLPARDEDSSRRIGIAWVAGAAAIAMVLAFATGSGTWQLLLGPGSMTWAIFALFTGRILLDAAAPWRARLAAAAAVALLAWTALSAVWPALLFPLLAALVARSKRPRVPQSDTASPTLKPSL